MKNVDLRRPTLTSLTADAVLDLIQDRRLGEGDTIPSSAEISEALGVSRTVVREAIAELSGQGLLLRQQGAQSVITVPGSKQLERLVRLRFAVRGSDLQQVQELRESIEISAAELAAARATDVDIGGLSDALADLRTAADIDALHRADLAFHRAVVVAAHNDLMQMMIEAVSPLLDVLLVKVWDGWTESGSSTVELVEAHALIFDGIVAGDPERAGAAMRSNLAQGRAAAEAHL
jgi:GntR family transcriptional repressor for pyruvate dehydrogenase complex